jgi:glutaredoxin
MDLMLSIESTPLTKRHNRGLRMNNNVETYKNGLLPTAPSTAFSLRHHQYQHPFYFMLRSITSTFKTVQPSFFFSTMTVPKLTIYNNIACPYANRVLIALQETQQEYELVDIDLKTPRPEYYLKEVNPYGEVPALKAADGNVILESLVIAEYLADSHPDAK